MDDLKAHVESQLLPMVEDYLALVKQLLADNDDTITQKKLKENHLRVSELLLQTLLKIDCVQCSNDALKAKRKDCVKFIQAHLDSVDAAKIKVESHFSQS